MTTAQPDDFVIFDHVQKSYDGKTLVVADLTLAIQKGEFLTMLGPSGSGKTTCLMMLAGFETVTHGEIRLSGRPINNIPPNKRGIGMVFQNYALFPHLTVAENLAFPLSIRKMGRAEISQRVRRVLDMVKMDSFQDRRPAQLSGGQQQRIALARALVFEPDLVLMDEPLGALDKQLREHMQYEIKHIHENLGVTMVYVTHDQGEALTMSDRVAVFHNGEIQQLADPITLYEKPQNAFVAQFIGENNTLFGTARAFHGDNAVIDLDDGTQVQARAIDVAKPGQRTVLSLRPERVTIAPRHAPTENHLQSRVREVIFLGDHIRCRMKVAGNDDFILKVPNHRANTGLKTGDIVDIGWDSADCRAFLHPHADNPQSPPHAPPA